ncbi:MAG TPA: tetratricopeptide repeat protein, partial [Gemmataceae bacterium]
YRLVELDTGRELARLEDPEQTGGPAVFSPDGTRLIATARDGLRVWDLRRIRAELGKLGLDWDAPPYPGAPAEPPAPLEIRVVGAGLADPMGMQEYERARDWLTLARNPFDPDARHRLGADLLRAGKPGAAHLHLSAALAFRPDLHEARRLRARAALLLRRWDEAIDDASRYLEHYPDDTGARYVRAQARRLAERHDEAVADYTALLEKFPRDPQLYEQRALCHDALGRAEPARADLEAALRLAPDDPETLNGMAWRLLAGPPDRRDPARALELIRKAVAKRPDNPMYLNTLGVAQYRNGMLREAVATLEKSLAAGKGQWDAFDLFFLAMCHARLGEPDKARDCYDRAARWTAGKKDLGAAHAEELKQFRAEAAEVLSRKV